MDTYAEKYFHAQALEKGYELFPGYNVPDFTEIAAFRQSIEQLPSQETPEIFGLHTNADLTFRTLQYDILNHHATIANCRLRALGGISRLLSDPRHSRRATVVAIRVGA
eukprot:2307024-Pyramimonas_sp.AAC.2